MKYSGMKAVTRKNAVAFNARLKKEEKDSEVKRGKRQFVLDEMAIIMLLNYTNRMNQYLKESMHDQGTTLYVVEIRF